MMQKLKSLHDAEVRRIRYAQNPETKHRDDIKRVAAQKRRYSTDPEWKAHRIATARIWKRFTRRGITILEFDRMLEIQHFKCVGCDKEISGKSAFIDHDHETKAARGLLCHQCNLIVHKHATPEILRKLAKYLDEASGCNRFKKMLGLN